MDSGNVFCESVSLDSLRRRVALIDLEGCGRRGAAVGGINICVCQHPGLTAELACLSCSGRDILCSWSKEGAEASDNNRINGSLQAHARLMRCAASLLRPLTASHWWPCSLLPSTSHGSHWRLMPAHGGMKVL